MGVQPTDGNSIVTWDSLFVISVRCRDGLRKLRFKRGVFEPVEVRFVSVFCREWG